MPVEPNTLYNLEPLKATTAGDNDFLIKILSTFLKNNQEQVEKMQKALDQQNFQTIGEIAHKMLSSYKHLEVNELIDPLSELEQITLGENMAENQIRQKVAYISQKSDEVFKGIENEIESIKSEE